MRFSVPGYPLTLFVARQRDSVGRRLNSRIAVVPFALMNVKDDLEEVGSDFDGESAHARAR